MFVDVRQQRLGHCIGGVICVFLYISTVSKAQKFADYSNQ